jgi:thiol:disulfide interchange protein/DsbC/DsbD-like thiol-disulfide interchange protein
MRHCKLARVMALFLAAMTWGSAAMAVETGRRHVAVDVLAEKSAVEPGKTLTLAVRERIDPGWHTYWINPGDSGEPTSIEWSFQGGLAAGSILWPIPHVIMVGPLAEYGYDDEILLLTEIKVPEKIEGDSATLAAKVSYLVCKDICIPEESRVQITLPVERGGSAAPSAFAEQIAKARAALPQPLPGSAAYSANRAKEALRLTASAEPSLFAGVKEARFYPLSWGSISNPAPQPMAISGGQLTLDMKQGDTKETPEKLEGLLVLTKSGGDRIAYVTSATRGPDSAAAGGLLNHTGGSTVGGDALRSASAAGGGSGLGLAVLFAFLGGAILNLMPCVFPVLALKALAFAKKADGGHWQQGVAYLLGVLASFVVLAALILIFRESSSALGWGFQFQSPAFVLALAILFFVMGLSLSGVVTLGAGLMSIGDSLSRKPGNAGYFFTGVLAAIAATPCTAPFMGAAIGYAVTQPSYILAAVMLALGLGFAAPVLILSISPALQHVLPKPGAWMETLKQVLAFPLYATAAWLVWVLSIQAGSDGVMAAALAIVGVGFAAWLAHKTAYAPFPVKMIAPILGVVTFAVTLSMAETAESVNAVAGSEKSVLAEEPFTQSRLDALKAEGRPVFVNLTAAWCITCKVNERVALKSPTVAQAFQSGGVAYLKGDWTRANPEITELLRRFGRAGVPLYLFYPGSGQEPRVLPQILTAGLVLDEIKAKPSIASPSHSKGA